MGVIYTSHEVGRLQVPQPTDHLWAAREVLRRVSRLCPVSLTMVHGSVPENRFNLRSDLDVLVEYSTPYVLQEPEIVDEIKEELDAIGDKSHVKIEANIWPADENETARVERMYDLLFSRHLASSMADQAWCVGEPDWLITKIAATSYSPDVVKRVAANYTTYKHSGFAKAPRKWNEYDRACTTAMQRALELPKAAKRKLNQTFSALYPDAVHTDEILGDSSAYRLAMDQLDLMSQMDREYTAILTQLVGNHDSAPNARELADYGTWLTQSYRRAMGLGLIATSSLTRVVTSSLPSVVKA